MGVIRSTYFLSYFSLIPCLKYYTRREIELIVKRPALDVGEYTFIVVTDDEMASGAILGSSVYMHSYYLVICFRDAQKATHFHIYCCPPRFSTLYASSQSKLFAKYEISYLPHF